MKITVWSIIFLFLFSCKSSKKGALPFKRDIPDLKKGVSRTLQGIQYSMHWLPLDTLENGFDSLEIRIWLTSRFDSFQVVTLKNSDHSWSAMYYNVTVHLTEHRDSLAYYSFRSEKMFPKSGWTLLIDSLFRENILTLPDCSKIKDYDFPFDGGGTATFEIATATQYRLYMYELPKTYRKLHPEAQNASNILDILSNQFNIKYFASF